MQDSREIYKTIMDAEMIDEGIQNVIRNKRVESSYNSILGTTMAEPSNDFQNDTENTYLKVFLLKMSRDIHTIKICLILFSVLAIAGIVINLISSILSTIGV